MLLPNSCQALCKPNGYRLGSGFFKFLIFFLARHKTRRVVMQAFKENSWGVIFTLYRLRVGSGRKVAIPLLRFL